MKVDFALGVIDLLRRLIVGFYNLTAEILNNKKESEKIYGYVSKKKNKTRKSKK